MAFAVIYSPEAVDHLRALPRALQVLVIQQVDKILAQEPTLPTRKRKLLRPNPVAPWELRPGSVRVFYDVQEEPERLVKIAAVGLKKHSGLWIGKDQIHL